jgi:hypothetical protein
MTKTALALTFILTLFTAAFCTQIINLAEANPDWAYTGADWRHVATITGTGDQKTTIFVPSQAHTRVYGNCTSGSGTAQFGVFDDFGGSVRNYTSAGFHDFSGTTSFSSRRGPANVSVVIRTTNILSYTVVLEYNAAAPTTTSTSPNPTQAPSPSPSQEPTSTPYTEPQQRGQEIIASVAFASAVFAAGLGFLIYLSKENKHERCLPVCLCFRNSLQKKNEADSSQWSKRRFNLYIEGV